MFAGKVALVTGGGSGIGAAAARRLAGEGAAVVVADVRQEAAAHTVALIEAAGGTAVALAADIAQPADNARMFEVAQSRYGGADFAFLNAGILQPYVPLEEVTLELFDRIMAVNLRGAFLGIQQAVRHLRPGGACVVTASAAGVTGFAQAAAYATAKHGVIGLVKSAAEAFAARGLRINAVCPGLVMTPMNNFAADDGLVAPDALADPPYRGGMTGQHVAELALFLLSRRSAAMNGQAHLVDAAMLSAFPPMP